MQDRISSLLAQSRQRTRDADTGDQAPVVQVSELPLVEVGDDDYRSVHQPCDALDNGANEGATTDESEEEGGAPEL